MVHRVISLKYRPQDFDELTGQSHIVLSLKGAIRSGRIGHAFLFAGPRGVGKTTMARILAKSLNCIQGPTVHPCQKCQSCHEITQSRSIDVVEIDGASNRGIDEIRNLREGVMYSPLQGRYKIYIIDEVHMLTPPAFNALLKTLEEPPPKVIFIFATTNPVKVLTTILSRCQRFMFKRLSAREIISRLQTIAEQENIKITKNALHYIANRADGSIRDGESILEQLVSFVEGQITEDDIFKLIGFMGNSFYFELLKQILAGDLRKVISVLNKGIEDGADPIEIYRGFTGYLRAVFLSKIGMSGEFIELNSEEIEALKGTDVGRDTLIAMLQICLRFEEMMRRSVNVRIVIELLLSRLVYCCTQSADSNSESGNVVSALKQPNLIGMKARLFTELQEQSPKLAGIIHDAEIKEGADSISITAKSEFSKAQLLKHQKQLESILKKLVKGSFTLEIGLVKSKEEKNDMVEAIRALFDGEEVR